MGTFSVAAEVGDPTGRRFQRIEALVDTGSTYTVVPASLLEALGVTCHATDRFALADGRSVDLDFGQTWLRAEGRTVITLVVFGEAGSRPLLGAYALEGLRLAPDPIRRCLVPVSALLLALRAS